MPTRDRNVKVATARNWTLAVAGIAVLSGAAFVAYLPAIQGGFIWDDELLVTRNDLVKAPDGLWRMWFTSEPTDYWPLTNTLFWFQWRLWGEHSAGYHIGNLVLQIGASLLIWAILGQLRIPGGYLAAVLFAVHPVNVESVAWIAQQKNMLALVLFLLSMWFYLRFEERGGSWNAAGYWLSIAVFLLAMLSKGSVAMLPVLLLAIVWWRRGRITATDVARTAPFFLISALLVAINIWFQTHGSGEVIRSAGAFERFAGAGAAVWFYLSKAILPLDLIFIYPQWQIGAKSLLWWLPIFGGAAVTALLWHKRESAWGRPLLFAWVFFCVGLVPVMGFTDVYFMMFSLVADHYQQIAMIAVVALAAAAWCYWYRAGAAAGRLAALATVAAVAGSFVVLSHQQSKLYADTITLYQSVLARNPGCWLAYNNLGVVISRTSRRDGKEYFEKALALNPRFAEAHDNLGLTLAEMGRVPEAMEHFQEALKLNPRFPEACNNMGNALVDSGRPDEAISYLKSAVALRPSYALAHDNLGTALFRTERFAEASEEYAAALRAKPDYADAGWNLALSYARLGQRQDASQAAEAALRMAHKQGKHKLMQEIESWLRKYPAD